MFSSPVKLMIRDGFFIIPHNTGYHSELFTFMRSFDMDRNNENVEEHKQANERDTERERQTERQTERLREAERDGNGRTE